MTDPPSVLHSTKTPAPKLFTAHLLSDSVTGSPPVGVTVPVAVGTTKASSGAAPAPGGPTTASTVSSSAPVTSKRTEKSVPSAATGMGPLFQPATSTEKSTASPATALSGTEIVSATSGAATAGPSGGPLSPPPKAWH